MKQSIRTLLSIFILNKDRRRAYKNKYNKIYHLKQELNQMVINNKALGHYTGFLPCYYQREITYANGVKNKIINNHDDYIKDIETLKANLEPEALNWLENYLNIQTRYEKGQTLSVDDIFNRTEKINYEMAISLSKQIIREKNYYAWGKYKLPYNMFDASVFIYRNGVESLKNFNQIFSKKTDNVIIDAGAYVLDSALAIRDLTDATIHSFEPTKSTYEIGLKTIELNNLQNIVYEDCALGEEVGECQMVIADELVPGANKVSLDSTETAKGKATKYTVKVNTIDNYVKENNLKVGLIKTDVEGFEPSLLRGAINTIKKQKPMLAISIYHNYHDFYKIKPWLEELNLGYKFTFFKGPDNNSVDIMLLCEVR